MKYKGRRGLRLFLIYADLHPSHFGVKSSLLGHISTIGTIDMPETTGIWTEGWELSFEHSKKRHVLNWIYLHLGIKLFKYN